jgi:hypothetical protein
MTNSFYAKTGNPATNSILDSQILRDEFSAIEAGLDKFPTLSSSSDNVLEVNPAGTAVVATRTFANLTTNQTIGGIKSFSDAPIIPTQSAGDSSTKAASTAYADNSFPANTHAATSKATPVDADELALLDSATTFSIKKFTWANLKALLQTTLPFLQAGTGAVLRSVQDELRTGINVKQFGAVGDGTTNDSAAIQAAITYAESLISSTSSLDNFSPTILFPSGKYLLSTAITVTKHGIGITGTPGRGALIVGDNILFDCGDYTNTYRAARITFSWLNFRATNTANATAAIKLYRTTNVRIKNCIFSNFSIDVDCFRASSPTLSECFFYKTERTVNAIAFVRMQGIDESVETGEIYTPGGGFHVTDCEFAGARKDGSGTELNYTEAAFLIKSCDGMYIENSHLMGYRYGLDIFPDGTASNQTISDLMFSNVYFDEPSTIAANPRLVNIRGTVNVSIAKADTTLVNSIYQGIRFTGCYLRCAYSADAGVYSNVTDGGGWVSAGHKLKDIQINGGSIRQAVITGVTVAGSSSSAVESYNMIVDGVGFELNNFGGTATASAISAEVESILINGCGIGADYTATDKIFSINLSALPSNEPSSLITNNNLSKSNSLDLEPISISNIAGAISLISNNIFPGLGKELSQVYKGTTTSAAPSIIWSTTAISTGQVGMVNTRCIGSNSTASEFANYEHRTSFNRPNAGSAALVGLATVRASDNITGSNMPVVLGLLTGVAWASTTAYAAGDLITNAGNVYLVMIAGTSSSSAPTFTSGTATNGTCTLGYIAVTAPNTLALIVSGTAATTINWCADIEFMAVP